MIAQRRCDGKRVVLGSSGDREMERCRFRRKATFEEVPVSMKGESAPP
jgi:hypothetical protein